MSSAGDRARASILVAVSQAAAWTAFTEDIDQWWRRGLAYRAAGKRRGVICLESGVGGRLFEVVEREGERDDLVIETGRVTCWEPPTRLAFEWRNVNFAQHEKTLVEVMFSKSRSGTLVEVTHSGWSQIRSDHPARHGKAVATFLREQGMWWADQLRSLAKLGESD